MDEDGNGVLSKEELLKGIEIFKQKFGYDEQFDDIDNLIRKIDLDGNGEVDIKEFITTSINLKDMS